MRHLTANPAALLHVFDFAMIAKVPGCDPTNESDAFLNLSSWTNHLWLKYNILW